MAGMFWGQAIEAQDIALRNEQKCVKTAKTTSSMQRCQARMEADLGESTKYRTQAIGVYKYIVKNHPDFKDYYITLNELDVILKKISTKWPNGEWTKQIVLDNHKRIRVYCTHPLEFDGTYITEMTEGQLGSLYENTDPNLNLDKMPF